MSNFSNAAIAILDDGELVDVREVLDELDLEFSSGFGNGDSGALLISTPGYAFEKNARGSGFVSDRWAFHIVVTDELTRDLRVELKEGRCDFLVQRPTHPAALKMLFLYALYTGRETRRLPRVAMGEPVKVRAGLMAKPATLIQLSTRGCGLLYAGSIEEGDKLTVVLPSEITGGKALSLESRVATVQPASVGEPGELELAVVFRPLDVKIRRVIQRTMAAHAVGSAALRPRKRVASGSRTMAEELRAGGHPKRPTKTPAPRTHAAAAAARVVEKADLDTNRRVAPRKQFQRPVMASGGGVADTLIGRDLAIGGMRVAPDPRLSVGDEFKLMIYGMTKGQTILVKAVLIRDDGDEGCVLQFKGLPPKSREMLQALVDRLPTLSSKGGPAGPHTIVSEIVSDED